MLLKAKHVLFRIVEVNNPCTKKAAVTINCFQRYCSSNPEKFVSKSPKSFESVVSLDPSELKDEPEEKPRTRLKLSDMEQKYFKKHLQENKDLDKPRKNYTNLYENVAKNELYFRECVMRLNSKNKRKKENRILIDNLKIIRDAIASGFQPSVIFYTRASSLETLNLDSSVRLLRVSYKQIETWSDVASSQGILGVFEKPPDMLQGKENYDSIPLTIICDDIRDPKNMGSLLRVAAGVGCRKLVLTKGCVDIWNEKVIRAAAGAHFQFPYLCITDWSDMENEISDECKIVLADSKCFVEDTENVKNLSDKEMKMAESLNIDLPLETFYSTTFGNQDVAIVIGNEHFGLSENAYLLAQKRKGVKVFIPLYNKINSLNSAVAMGILAYEVRKQFEMSKTVSVSQ